MHRSEIKAEEKLSACKQIYHFAKADDWKGLDQFLLENKCSIDVRENRSTAVMLLAQENDSRFIILINRYNANRSLAVYGLGLGGHFDEMEEWIRKGASRDTAVEGLGRGGHFKKMEEWIGKGGSRDWAVRGLGAGGHFKKMEEWIRKGGSKDEAVRGLGNGGYFEKMEEWIGKGGSRDWAVFGLGAGGYFEKMEEWIGKGGSRDGAVYGLGAGGYFEKMEEWIAKGGSRGWAVYGLGAGGYFEKMEEWIGKGGGVDRAVRGLGVGGHYEKMEEWIGKGGSRDEAILGLRTASGFRDAGTTLRILSRFIKDETRKQIADGATRIVAPNFNIHALLPQANQISLLMKKYKIGFNQAQDYLANPKAMTDLMKKEDVNLEQAIALSSPEVQGLAWFNGKTQTFPTPLLEMMATYAVPIQNSDIGYVAQRAQGKEKNEIAYNEQVKLAVKFFEKKNEAPLFVAGETVFEAIQEYKDAHDHSLHHSILDLTIKMINDPRYLKEAIFNQYQDLISRVDKSNTKLISTMGIFLGIALTFAAMTYLSSTLLFAASGIGASLFIAGVIQWGRIAYSQSRDSNKKLTQACYGFFNNARNQVLVKINSPSKQPANQM